MKSKQRVRDTFIERRFPVIIVDLQTKKREEFIDVTRLVESELTKLGKKDGICTVYVPHTTAAVTINENTDPYVVDDILHQLRKLIPIDGGYAHSEGNSDAHAKASVIGPSVTILIEEGHLKLGRWQGIYFCEFDGPRRRKIWIKFI
ncbi:MAG: secondary thiamine-phosphate synthase enzyme YjbQ [Candidatus Glassbacteria bacterium]